MAFAFSDAHGQHLDWRNLYFSIRNAVHDPKSFPSLSNRKRIWDLLEVNYSLFLLHLNGMQLTGEPTKWSDLSRTAFSGHDYSSLHLSKLISGETSNPPYGFDSTSDIGWCERKLLLVGSRELHIRSLPRLVKNSRCAGVGVSVVSFNGRSYVSGLRILLPESNDGKPSGCSLGFVAPSLETVFRVAGGQTFEGIQVAASARGIKALRPILGHDSVSETGWIGDINDETEDVTFGSLFPTTVDGSYAYAAGFDVSVPWLFSFLFFSAATWKAERI